MMITSSTSTTFGGAFGGLCAAIISDSARDVETNREYSSQERALQFLSRTLLATIWAVVARTLACYVGLDLVMGSVYLGVVLGGVYYIDSPEASLAHKTTAKVLAVVCGTTFGFFPWAQLLP